MSVGPDELIGEVVDGRYTVLERIADGGMASVYRAVDTRLERDVALKVMKPHLAHDTAFVARFRKEARAAARLAHPNVVGVFDQGSDGDRVFLAMEYVPGRTLRQVINADAPLAPGTALDLMDPMLQALAAAHEAGLVHRDVKPENVIVRTDGVIKVADFGLARAVTSETATSVGNEVLGTLSYLAPEQVELSDASSRSDVYAAGLILFELLTGRKAVVGDSIPNVLYQHLHQDVPAPSSLVDGIPPELDALLAHATRKAPDQRPADAGDFLAEVRHVRGLLPSGVPARVTRSAVDTANTTAVLPVASVMGPARTGDTAVYAVTPTVAGGSAGSGSAGLARSGASPSRGTSGFAATPPSARPPRPAPTGRGRRRGALIGILLALIAAAVAGGWYLLAGPGAPTTVPKLAGLTVQQANDALTIAHLDATEITVFSETVAKDHVVSAKPGEGAQLRRGDTVTLTVSKGLERYDVPRLAGKTKPQATALLADANLEVGKVSQAYSETVKVGLVLSSDPVAGSALKKGAPVGLVLSKGRQPIDVPDLTGKTWDEATTIVTSLGLTLQQGEAVFSDTVPKDQIAEQSPRSGQVFKGDTMTASMSRGPELFKVPGVFRKSEKEARAILRAAGFTVKVNYFLGGPLDMVTGQTPSGGSMAPKGSLVIITVV